MHRTTTSTGSEYLLQAVLLVFFMMPVVVSAASSREIDIKTEVAMEKFRENVKGADAFLENEKAVLVFPEIVTAGIGVGGEYGEGALLQSGKTADYYKITGAFIGIQLGGQIRSVILVFLEQEALEEFRAGSGWKVGVDGSVAFVEAGVGKNINSVNIKEPIVGFVTSNKGLMFNMTLEGSKISRLVPEEKDNREQKQAEQEDTASAM